MDISSKNYNIKIDGSYKLEEVPILRKSIGPETSEILSKPPTWLIRWGITVYFLILMLILLISWFVKYPELVKAKVKIVSKVVPKPLISEVDGRLTKLLVEDGDYVKVGALIGQIENTSNVNEVEQLSILVNKLTNITSNGKVDRVYTEAIADFSNLGELQKSYETFQNFLIRTKSYTDYGVVYQKIKMQENDLSLIDSLKHSLYSQIVDQKHDVELIIKDLDMSERLLKDKVISASDYRSALSKYYNKKQQLDILQGQIANLNISKNQKSQDILELKRSILEQRNNLIQSIRSLKSEIVLWKKKYQLIAPIAGIVVFVKPVQQYQVLKTKEDILYITPEEKLSLAGELKLSQNNLGKLKIGQKVILKLSSYPYQQFGVINATLSYISSVSQDSTFLAKISFPQNLNTSNGYKVPFKNGLIADAEIITRNHSLLEQFFQDFIVKTDR